MFAPLFSIALAGCGGGSGVELTNVSGAVTFDGTPVVAGQIEFVPKEGHAAPNGFAAIIDGRYDTSVEGSKGIIPGPYSVRITAYPEKLPEGDIEDEEAVADEKVIEPLFIGYAMDADIQGSTHDVNVPSDAAGTGMETGGQVERDP